MTAYSPAIRHLSVTACRLVRACTDTHATEGVPVLASPPTRCRCWASTQLSSQSRRLWWTPSCQVGPWLAAGPATWLFWYVLCHFSYSRPHVVDPSASPIPAKLPSCKSWASAGLLVTAWVCPHDRAVSALQLWACCVLPERCTARQPSHLCSQGGTSRETHLLPYSVGSQAVSLRFLTVDMTWTLWPWPSL